MNLPFLKHRADVVNALANLGIMRPVSYIPCTNTNLLRYDVHPPAPGDFGFIAQSLGVNRMGHALRERSLGEWLRLIWE